MAIQNFIKSLSSPLARITGYQRRQERAELLEDRINRDIGELPSSGLCDGVKEHMNTEYGVLLHQLRSRHPCIESLEKDYSRLLNMKWFPALVNMLYGAQEITVENPFEFARGYLETGGNIKYEVVENGSKALRLRLSESVYTRTSGSVRINHNGHGGTWHYHPGILPPLPSPGDLSIFSSLNGVIFYKPHFLVSESEGRLYIPKKQAEILAGSLKAQLHRLSVPDDAITEVKGLGIKIAGLAKRYKECAPEEVDFWYLRVIKSVAEETRSVQ